MNTPFDVNQYWLKRGQTYIREERLGLEYHRVQERFLLDVLRAGQLPMRKVLELGCGFGRVTRLMAEAFPEAKITGLDLSPDQLDNARRYCAGRENVSFATYDFYSNQPLPGDGVDCVLAIEVFLHHPETMVRTLVQRAMAAATFLVNIDWSEAWPWTPPEHVWIHDYARLYQEAGLKCATFLLPEKVEGKQQKLFIAGRELPSALTDLARSLDRPEPAAPKQTETDRWLQQVEEARREITQTVPDGAEFILVNDDQWGEAPWMPGRRAIPFLECDGKYWGPPADDATALRELERLQAAGASHIVFAWTSFWWLDHYAGLRERLFGRHECRLKNERVIVFRLNP